MDSLESVIAILLLWLLNELSARWFRFSGRSIPDVSTIWSADHEQIILQDAVGGPDDSASHEDSVDKSEPKLDSMFSDTQWRGFLPTPAPEPLSSKHYFVWVG